MAKQHECEKQKFVGTRFCSTLYCPTIAHNVKKRIGLLKHFKIKEATPTCFGLQGNHHRGATGSTQLKLHNLVQCGYIELVQDVVRVMAAY